MGVELNPFRLACTQCSSKVIVRHEHMLGQSLPCPKCQGLIQIPAIPPAAPIRPAPQVLNSAAMTKGDDPIWDEMMANESFMTPEESETESISRFRPMDDAAPLTTTFTPAAPLAPLDPSSDLPLHRQNWQSSQAAKRRQLMVIATIATSSSVLALVGFLLFMRFVGGSNKTDVAVDSGIKVPTIEKPVQPENTGKPPVLDQNPSPETADIQPVTESPPAEAAQPDPTLPPAQLPAQDAELIAPDASPAPDATEQPVTPVDAATTTPDTNEAATAKPQLPEGLDGSETNDELPDFLRPWNDILSPNNAMSDAGFGNNQTENELDVQYGDIDIGLVYHPPAKPVPKWETKASQSLPSFKMSGVSTLRCIDLLSKMTGVGITIDWQSCRVAGIDLTKSMDIDVKDKTIGELVAMVAESNQLELSFDNLGLPVLAASQAAMNAKLPTDWNVLELFASDDKAGSEQLAVETLIALWGFADRCTYNDGRVEWNELASPIDKANLLASLCELSLIRKSNPNSPWHPAKHPNLLFSQSDWQKSSEGLNRTISMSTIVAERRPIPEILSVAAKEVEMEILIDWQRVWQHGLVPNELAVAVLRGRTLPQVANRFINDYSIELIPIANDTVWISTGDARRKFLHVMPVRLPQDFKLDDLKQSLKLLSPLGPDNRSRFRVVPIPGLADVYYARICSPRVDQIDDSDLVLSFGWPKE